MRPHDACGRWWYDLDSAHCVVAVSDGWDAFARDNDGAGATGSAVVGRSLWEFVRGTGTAHLLRRLFHRAERAGLSAEVPFRCDSPGVRRWMSFAALPRVDGGVRVVTRTLMEREHGGRVLHFAGTHGQHPGMLKMCGWCDRIQTAPGLWLEVDEAAAQMRLFNAPLVPEVSSGICPPCYADVAARMERRA